MDFIGPYVHRTWFYLTHLFSAAPTSWDEFEWFLVNMALFIPLAFIFPNKRGQKPFRSDMFTDMIYWFGMPIFYLQVSLVFFNFLSAQRPIQWMQHYAHFSTMPLLVQAFLILLIGDFLQYWAHRGFHASALWKFHAVHHSSQEIDWLSSARFHPVNIILYSTTVNVLVYTLGFSGEAFLILVPFNAIYSPLVHANLNWNYGPFKYLLASPVFHRWHHTHPDEGGNKNFAPTFPFLDLMFGTFYMPEGKQPQVFGTPYDPITGNFLNQLIYPFKSTPAAHPPEEPAPQANPAA